MSACPRRLAAFIPWNLPVPLRLCIRHISPFLPTLLMHPPSQATLDNPPRRFVSSSSATPTGPPRSAVLASPECYRPQRTSAIGAHNPVEQAWRPMTTLMMTSTIRLGPPDQASLLAGPARMPRTTSLPVLNTNRLSRR